jgi:hypothetical protein
MRYENLGNLCRSDIKSEIIVAMKEKRAHTIMWRIV